MALLIGACSLMEQAAVNDNKVLTDFIEKQQADMAKEGDKETMTVERGLFGEQIVVTVNIPGSLDELNQLPQNQKDAMKNALIQGFKQENTFSKDVVKAMEQERAIFVFRFAGNDGNTYDIYFTPEDLK